MSDKRWVVVPSQPGKVTLVPSKGEIVRKEYKSEASQSVVETLLFGAATGLGGYALGKKHGHNDGYNQAKVEDAQLIEQYQTQFQNQSRDNAQVRGENRVLLQGNASLRTENEILKGLLLQKPTTPESEAILKTLERVEFRLTQVLPPIFEDGEDHDSRRN